MASRPVDEKIVKLTLDTKSFIANASEAINSFTRMNDTFSGNRTTLASMANGIEAISSKFSALGVIGATVLTDLTRKAESFIAPILSFGIGGIIDGGLNRAMRLEDAYFKLSGLGADVKAVIADVEYGVSGTAYSLDAAATVAAQLTASGMTAGNQMKGVLRGISGVAAMTSSTYEDIGSIYTTVAGNGKLMTEQLRQLSSRGMNASATMSKVFNTVRVDGKTASMALTDDVKKTIKALTGGVDMTEEKMNELVSKGKIDFATFSAVMDEAFGEHAKEANKTFQGAMSNVRAALAKIGQAFFTPLIQNEGPVVNLLNAIREKLNDIKDSVAADLDKLGQYVGKFINGIADAISNIGSADSAITHIVSIIQNLWTVLKNIGTPIAEALAKLIPEGSNGLFMKFLTYLDDLTKKLAELDMSKWNAFWDKVGTSFKGFKDFLGDLSNNTGKLIEKLKDMNIVGMALKGGALIWLFDRLFTFAKTSKFLANLASSLFQLKFAAEKSAKTGNVISNLTGAIKNIGAGLKVVGVALFVLAIKQLAEGIKILATIDGEDALKAIGVLGVVLLEMRMFANKLYLSAKSMLAMSVLITAFSKAMNMLADVVIKIGAIRWADLGKGLFGSAMIVIGLTMFVEALQDIHIKPTVGLTLMMLAVAIDLIAVAVAGLTKLDPGALFTSITILGLAMLELVAAVWLLSGIEKPVKSLVGGGTLLMLAVAFDILSVAIAGLTFIDGPKLLETVMYMGMAIFELVGAVFALSTISGPLKALAGGVTMIMLAVSIDILAAALAGLSMIDGEKLGVSLIVLAGALGTLIAASYALQGAVVGVLALAVAGIALGLVSSSLMIFAGACKVLETIDWNNFGEGMGGAIAKLALGIGAMIIAAPGAKALSNAGQGLLALGGAMKLMQGLDLETMGPQLSKFMKSLGVALDIMLIALPGALALTVAAPGLIMFAIAMQQMQGLDLSFGQELSAFLVTFGLALDAMLIALPGALALLIAGPALIIFAKSLDAFDGGKMAGYKENLEDILLALALGLTAMIAALPGAAALLVAAPALGVLGKSLKSFEKLDIEKATDGLAGFLAKLAGSLTLMDAALPGAEALKVAAPALTDLANGLTALMGLELETALSVINQLVDALSQLLTVFSENQNGVASVGTLAENLTTLNTAVTGLQTNSSELAKALNEIKAVGTIDWNSYFAGIQTAVDSSINTALEALKAGLDSISSTITSSGETLTSAVTDIGNGMAENFATAMTQMTSQVTQAASDMVTAGSRALDNGKILASQSGAYFAQGFANGIKNNTYLAIDAAGAMGKKAYDKLVESIKQGSPSKLTTESGGFFAQGFINGIRNKIASAANAAGDLGVNALAAIDSIVNTINAYLNDELNLSPVVSPVLDMDAMDELKRNVYGSLIDTSAIRGIQNGTDQQVSNDTIIENVEVTIEINTNNGLSSDEIARIARRETEDIITKEVRKIAIARR